MLVDGPAIAAELDITPGVIRVWAHRGYITRRGRDNRGRTLYDLDEVQAEAAQRGLIDEDSMR